MRHYIKNYGVSYLPSGRWAIVTDIEERSDKHGWPFQTKRVHTNLSYKNKNTAIKKAENFVRKLHQPFTDPQGNKVTFSFEYAGEIEY